jgi:hypothetical protein
LQTDAEIALKVFCQLDHRREHVLDAGDEGSVDDPVDPVRSFRAVSGQLRGRFKVVPDMTFPSKAANLTWKLSAELEKPRSRSPGKEMSMSTSLMLDGVPVTMHNFLSII